MKFAMVFGLFFNFRFFYAEYTSQLMWYLSEFIVSATPINLNKFNTS